MKFFPKENITLLTPLPSDQVLEKIKRNINSERDFKQFNLSKDTNQFEGTVFSNTFKINRILVYRNSFLPMTFGDICNTATGSKINLTIKLEKFQFVIFMIWAILLGTVSLISFFILIMELFYSGQFIAWALVTPAMFLTGYLFVVINFNKEMISVKEFLWKHINSNETLPS